MRKREEVEIGNRKRERRWRERRGEDGDGVGSKSPRNDYYYRLQQLSPAMDNAQTEKGKTSVFCLTQLHSALVGPKSQPQGSNSACDFRDSGVQYISPPASMRRGMNPCHEGRWLAGAAVLLLGRRHAVC